MLKNLKVNSSTIAELDYNTETNYLFVTFKNGDIYKYVEVEEALANNFFKATSKGQFLWKHIREKHAYSKVNRIN